MAHNKCLIKCPQNCDCIKDDIEELKRIKKISLKQLIKILEKYGRHPAEKFYAVIYKINFEDVAKDFKDLIRG